VGRQVAGVRRSADWLEEAYRRKTPGSAASWERARALLPGGVSRHAVLRSPHPIFMASARDQHVTDVDGNEYVDFCLNFGPILLGHGFPAIAGAVEIQARDGWGYGAPTVLEYEVAALIREMYPAAERVRFLNTGTEAILQMMRVARASTGRERLIKLVGAYHGAHDGAQFSARPIDLPSGIREGWLGIPDAEGLPSALAETMLAVPHNDLAALENCLSAYEGEIAGVIVDCAMNGCGLAPPDDGYLTAVQELTHAHGGLLLLDEVVTGFRWGPGGAAAHYGLEPDLVSFGKVLGGGAPIGAVCGRALHMRKFEADDHGRTAIIQSGTFAANPVSLTSAKALLTYLRDHPEVYDRLNDLGTRVRDAVNQRAGRDGLPLLALGVGSMFQIHAGVSQLRDYDDFTRRDAAFRAALYLHMAVHGLYLPTPTGTFFLSYSHKDADIDRFLDLLDDFLAGEYDAPGTAP
jgi:glutamate-1-semialdehyde 2,1-aminomutase